MCSVCSLRPMSPLKPSATLEPVELKVIQAPDSTRGGKVVREKQRAKTLTHGGPFLSQALERLWQWECCHERK